MALQVGKLLPNLKITLGSDEILDQITEERESEPLCEGSFNSESIVQDVEIVRSWIDAEKYPKIYKNNTGGFTTGIDLISEDNSEKLDKRAERFGLEKESELTVTQSSINSLYESMGVLPGSTSASKLKNIRLDALHMRGINELNTSEIFQYFQDYAPASVEWINDFSCNVVWLDGSSCARALLGISQPLPESKSTPESNSTQDSGSTQEPKSTQELKSTQESKSTLEPPNSKINKHRSPLNEDSSSLDSANESDSDKKTDSNMDIDESSTSDSKSNKLHSVLDIPVPPGCWRLGNQHPKAKYILLRFATKDDKKLPGAEKRSEYYKKYGNPNYGGLKGLISSSRKRKIQATLNKTAVEENSSKTESFKSVLNKTSDDEIDSKSSSKVPRMRMYADDEEINQLTCKRFKHHGSVHSRLGTKYTRDDLQQLGRPFERENSYSPPRSFNQFKTKPSALQRLGKSDTYNSKSSSQVDLRTKLKKHRKNSFD